jgi:hypothetical protein
MNEDTIAETVNRVIENMRIAQAADLYCCIICGELIADWDPDPPRYATHDSCEVALSQLTNDAL